MVPIGLVGYLAYPLLDRQIPTVLSYIEGEEFHGTQAKAQLVRNSHNTAAYFRDYIGKEYVCENPGNEWNS